MLESSTQAQQPDNQPNHNLIPTLAGTPYGSFPETQRAECYQFPLTVAPKASTVSMQDDQHKISETLKYLPAMMCLATLLLGQAALFSAASGAIGAYLLKAAGHSPYVAGEAAAAGAVAGATLMAPLTVPIMKRDYHNNKQWNNILYFQGLLFVISAVSGLLGGVMVNNETMNFKECGAATASGSLVFFSLIALIDLLRMKLHDRPNIDQRPQSSASLGFL